MLSDREILYNTYIAYPKHISKKLIRLNQSKVISSRAELLHNVEKSLFYLNSRSISETERLKLINKGKKLYQDYCEKCKANPEVDSERLSQKIDELLGFMSSNEAERISLIRSRHVHGNEIDVEAIFTEKKNIKKLICKTADRIISEELDADYTVIGKDAVAIYMTATGQKYHKANCPYCKGKTLFSTTLKAAELFKLSPCQCIEKNSSLHMGGKELGTSMSFLPPNTGEYITAFVDESIRATAWRDVDDNVPEKHGVYSYIICEGYLVHEKQISDQNIICSNVSVAPDAKGPNDATIEAIKAVLLKLVSLDYRGNVLIYTDNMCAKDTWCQEKANAYLSKYFDGVTVRHISRENNKRADALGRGRFFVDISADIAHDILENVRGMTR